MVRYDALECQRGSGLWVQTSTSLLSIRNMESCCRGQRDVSSGCFEDNKVMEDPKKTEPNASEDYENKHSDEKNLDRDGGERQPTDHKQEPSK